jgi:hypothetical protein
MTIGFIFWLLMILWLVFGVLSHNNPASPYFSRISDGFLFVLLFLLGWKVFGFVIQG